MVLKYEHRLLSGKSIFRRDEGTFDHIVENAEAMLKVLCWDAIEAPSKTSRGIVVRGDGMKTYRANFHVVESTCRAHEA